MNIPIDRGLIVETEAQKFLRRHGANSQLQTVFDAARDHFPEVQTYTVRLLEDPDEDNHCWVVLHGFMTGPLPDDLFRVRKPSFYEDLHRRLPLPYHPYSFSVMIEPARE